MCIFLKNVFVFCIQHININLFLRMDQVFPTSRPKRPLKTTYGRRGARQNSEFRTCLQRVPQPEVRKKDPHNGFDSDSSSDSSDSSNGASQKTSSPTHPDCETEATENHQQQDIPKQWVKRDPHTAIEKLEKLYSTMQMSSPQKSRTMRNVPLETDIDDKDHAWNISPEASPGPSDDEGTSSGAYFIKRYRWYGTAATRGKQNHSLKIKHIS